MWWNKRAEVFALKLSLEIRTTQFFNQLFHSFINQVLSYACEILGFFKSKEIEKIHLKILKSVLNVKTTTFSASVYGELGRCHLYICNVRHVRINKCWIKIIKTENLIVKTICITMLNDAENAEEMGKRS